MHIPCDGRTVDARLDDGTTIQSMGPPSFGVDHNVTMELELSLNLPTFDEWYAKRSCTLGVEPRLSDAISLMVAESRLPALAELVTAYTRDMINLAVIPLYRR